MTDKHFVNENGHNGPTKSGVPKDLHFVTESGIFWGAITLTHTLMADIWYSARQANILASGK